MDRAHMHVARQSTLIFEKKRMMFFCKLFSAAFFKMCDFEFGFKEFFESSHANRITYCPRLPILCLE